MISFPVLDIQYNPKLSYSSMSYMFVVYLISNFSLSNVGTLVPVQPYSDDPGGDVRHQRRHVRRDRPLLGVADRQTCSAKGRQPCGLPTDHCQLPYHRPRALLAESTHVIQPVSTIRHGSYKKGVGS